MNRGMAARARPARARARRRASAEMAAAPAVDAVVDLGDLIVRAEHRLSRCRAKPGGPENAVTEVPVR